MKKRRNRQPRRCYGSAAFLLFFAIGMGAFTALLFNAYPMGAMDEAPRMALDLAIASGFIGTVLGLIGSGMMLEVRR